MNTLQGAGLGFIFLMGGIPCIAQQASTAFANLPEAPQVQVQPMLAPESFAISVAPGSRPQYSFAPSSRYTPPPHSPRIIDAKFLMINGLHLGLAVVDTEMTQHCIASHRCREGNPLMPPSHAGQLAVDFAFVAYGSGLSYRFRRHKSTLWWFPPTGGIVAHACGITTGLLHR